MNGAPGHQGLRIFCCEGYHSLRRQRSRMAFLAVRNTGVGHRLKISFSPNFRVATAAKRKRKADRMALSLSEQLPQRLQNLSYFPNFAGNLQQLEKKLV